METVLNGQATEEETIKLVLKIPTKQSKGFYKMRRSFQKFNMALAEIQSRAKEAEEQQSFELADRLLDELHTKELEYISQFLDGDFTLAEKVAILEEEATAENIEAITGAIQAVFLSNKRRQNTEAS